MQSTGTLVIALNDVWTSPSHGLEWTERHATAERWSPRSRFSFIALRPKPGFDGRILLIGGRNSTGTCLHDVWESSLKTIGSTWTPTVAPTVPTIAPTSAPVPSAPTVAPTAMPTVAPTSAAPTAAPTQIPTDAPTAEPTSEPTRAPVTQMPSAAPSAAPTRNATEDEAEEQRKAVRCCCVFLELIFVFIHTHTHFLTQAAKQVMASLGDDEEELASGGIIGIVVGAIVGGVVVLGVAVTTATLVIVLLVKRRRRLREAAELAMLGAAIDGKDEENGDGGAKAGEVEMVTSQLLLGTTKEMRMRMKTITVRDSKVDEGKEEEEDVGGDACAVLLLGKDAKTHDVAAVRDSEVTTEGGAEKDEVAAVELEQEQEREDEEKKEEEEEDLGDASSKDAKLRDDVDVKANAAATLDGHDDDDPIRNGDATPHAADPPFVSKPAKGRRQSWLASKLKLGKKKIKIKGGASAALDVPKQSTVIRSGAGVASALSSSTAALPRTTGHGSSVSSDRRSSSCSSNSVVEIQSGSDVWKVLAFVQTAGVPPRNIKAIARRFAADGFDSLHALRHLASAHFGYYANAGEQRAGEQESSVLANLVRAHDELQRASHESHELRAGRVRGTKVNSEPQPPSLIDHVVAQQQRHHDEVRLRLLFPSRSRGRGKIRAVEIEHTGLAQTVAEFSRIHVFAATGVAPDWLTLVLPPQTRFETTCSIAAPTASLASCVATLGRLNSATANVSCGARDEGEGGAEGDEESGEECGSREERPLLLCAVVRAPIKPRSRAPTLLHIDVDCANEGGDGASTSKARRPKGISRALSKLAGGIKSRLTPRALLQRTPHGRSRMMSLTTTEVGAIEPQRLGPQMLSEYERIGSEDSVAAGREPWMIEAVKSSDDPRLQRRSSLPAFAEAMAGLRSPPRALALDLEEVVADRSESTPVRSD